MHYVPLINSHDDESGGSLENRAEIMRGLAPAVRRAVKQQIAVTTKLDTTDNVRRSITTDEVLTTAKLLQDDGGLDTIKLTAATRWLTHIIATPRHTPVQEFAHSEGILRRFPATSALGHTHHEQEISPLVPGTATHICCATPDRSTPSCPCR